MTSMARARVRPSAIVDWLRANWMELAVVAAITLAATIVRVYKLVEYPRGFHGDEGLTGFDAQRVLDDGWVGPYFPSALGYPGGYIYWAAAVIKLVGNDDFGVRFASATLGILTIPVAYAAFRLWFGPRVALLGSAFLAFSAWHILYSRVAFLPIAWPFIEVVTMVPLFFAVRHRAWYWWALTGVCAGAGIMSYGSYPIFLPALGLFMLWVGVREYGLDRAVAYIRHMGCFLLGFYGAGFSLIQYVRDPDNDYFERARGLSLREQPQWKAADGPFEKIDVLWTESRNWFELMTWRGIEDGVDAAGWGPMLDPWTVALAFAGIVLLIAGWRRNANVFALLVLAILPLGSILTRDGEYRRCFGMIPMLMVAMALPLARAWDWSDTLAGVRRYGVLAVIAVIVSLVSIINVRYFFDRLAVSPQAEFAYVTDLAAASRYIDEQQPDYVYFLAARWTYNYETRRFLAPNVPGEDRSEEFSPRREVDLVIDRSQDAMFIFIGHYMERLEEVQQLYPEGRPYNGIIEGKLYFVAYSVPAHPDVLAAR